MGKRKMKNYGGRGWEKPYPNATGTFLDRDGKTWEVYKIVGRNEEVIYMRWDIDGEDPGASFSDQDGTSKSPNPIIGMMD
jgi:hypothetical protein